MTPWLRWGLWGLGFVVGLPLLLGLAWWLLNLADAEPQPWPPALDLPVNQVPLADNLVTILGAAPAVSGGFSLGECDAADCLGRWRQRLPELAARRAANPGFGTVCEGLATRTALSFEDTMPVRMGIDWQPPVLQALVSCHSWLLSRALDSAAAPETLHWLRQADRLDRAALAGSRSLMAQMVSGSLWGRKLQVLSALGVDFPAQRHELATLARFDEQAWLARQMDWVRMEANYQRTSIDSVRTTRCDDERLPRSGWGRWSCRLSASAAQPEYTTQLLAQRWLRVHGHLQQADSLPGALPTLRTLLDDADSVSPWQRIRHTVPHLLDDVARPTFIAYFERNADLQLAAEATRLWLQSQSNDLASQASPALRQRLSAPTDGAAGWQLTPHHGGSRGRLPLRWPTLS